MKGCRNQQLPVLRTLFFEATLALDMGDEISGGDGGTDFEFGSAWSFAGEVGEETFHLGGFGWLFIHGCGALRAMFDGS